MGQEQMETVNLESQQNTNIPPQNIPPPPVPSPQPEPLPVPEPSANPTETPSPNDVLQQRLLGAFAVITGLSIFLWFMVGAGFPWFMYVIYATFVIECIINAVKQRDLFFANWTVSQYIYRKVTVPKFRWYYIHAAIYSLINFMLFLTWMTNCQNNSYPWFIYPLCGWGVLLLVHYNFAIMHNKSKLLVFIAADIGAMLSITLRFALGGIFAVFIVLGLVAGIVYCITRFLFLFILYSLFFYFTIFDFLKDVIRRKGYSIHCFFTKQTPAPIPVVPTQPNDPSSRIHIEVGPDGTIIPPYSIHGQQQPAPIHAPHLYPSFNNLNNNNYNVPPTPMFYQPNGGAPMYYAYLPSQNNGYPTLTTVPAGSPYFAPIPTNPVSIPQAPQSPQVLAPNAAIVDNNKNNNNGEEKEEEEGYLLRNSPTRSYTGDKQ